jgi:alpha-D-xyloside xylohydrolase
VVFARSATSGGQQFPVHWGGDSTATFESMAESLRGGLSLHLSGFGFWSHDIGGFEHTASAAVYKRWAAFGLLSSHSRLHGNSSYRVPWVYDEEAVDVLGTFTRLKASLMPYIYQTAVQAHQFGMPTLRAMMLAFPGDPACETLDRQYMLGDALLVAPVFREDGIVDYYLPKGKWTNFMTDEVVDGGSWRRDQVDYLSIPLWAAENSVIPVGARDDRPDYDYAEGLTLHIFTLTDGAKVDVTIPDTSGAMRAIFHCERRDQTLRITREGAPGKWNVLIRGGRSAPVEVNGDEAILELS